MARVKTVRNIYDRQFEEFQFDGIWYDVFEYPETSGIWLIYGAEKHGKTWFALKLAKYLSEFTRTLYVSGEEGFSKPFVQACKRAGLDVNDPLKFDEYLPLEDLEEKLKKRKAPRVVFLDNMTIYSDELKHGNLKRLYQQYPKTLWVFLAHEERNKPYTAQANLASKLAKVRIRVIGLSAYVGGRVPGGTLMIDEQSAQLYHGSSTN